MKLVRECPWCYGSRLYQGATFVDCLECGVHVEFGRPSDDAWDVRRSPGLLGEPTKQAPLTERLMTMALLLGDDPANTAIPSILHEARRRIEYLEGELQNARMPVSMPGVRACGCPIHEPRQIHGGIGDGE